LWTWSQAKPVAVVVVAMQPTAEVDAVVVAATALGATTEVAVEESLAVAAVRGWSRGCN
jgi:hypothetical protein